MATRKNVHNTNCCVYECHSRKGKDMTIHFHYFPKNNSSFVYKANAYGVKERVCRRKAWENVLLMGKPVTNTMRVCSLHFTNDDYARGGKTCLRPKLKMTAVPSQNLPKKRGVTKTKSVGIINKRRYERLERRQVLREARQTRDPPPICQLHATEPKIQDISDESDVLLFEDLAQIEQIAVQGLLKLSQESVEEKHPNVDKGVQVTSGDIMTSFSSTIKKDSHLNSLTGIPNFNLLNALSKLITKLYPDKKQHKLGVKDRIILVLMKMKMAIKFNVLSFLFQVSPTTCRTVFDEIISYLANVLKPCIRWPSGEECEQNMPLCFKYFKNVRVVLDCMEIPIQKPKCLCCRVRTYSHYKGRQTIKIMTGVSPAGFITVLSKCYGGKSSDKAIFEQSGLIKMLQPRQDSVMVDKGFLIDDVCNIYFIKIIRPYFLKKKKRFTEHEAKMNVLISKARVHVERVNQRIRIFEIFNIALPWTLVPKCDEMLTVACAFVNLQTPVLADNKF